MVSMTNTAAEQLESFVQASGIPEGIVRLFLTGGGCCGPGFGIDVVPAREATDIAIVHAGTTLYIQEEAVELLDKVVIDFQDTFVLQGFQSSGCCS